MATIASDAASPAQRERAFFFYMALVILAMVVAGFGFFFVMGGSSFNSPWWVHLHAVSMTIWMGLYIMQNWLVYRGKVMNHRKMGVIVAAWGAWIIPLALVLTPVDIMTRRIPPFFDPAYFLMMDWLNVLAFIGIFVAALRMRDRPDWHKRLMLGGMINLIAVSVSRIVLPILFDQRGMWIVMLVLLSFFAVAMAFDKRMQGRVHPAYFWGAGALVTWVSLSFVAASFPPIIAFANALQT